MGIFDFLKPNKEDKSVPSVEPVKDYHVLVEMAGIISGNNEAVKADFFMLVQDVTTFCAKHAEWCEEILDCVDPYDRHTQLLVIFAYWLTGYDTDFKYGAYIDWKEETEEITSSLQEAIDNLGYPLKVEEIDVEDDDDTYEVLKKIHRYLNKKGYALAILDTDSDCYHLFVTTHESCTRLQKLGHTVDFCFRAAE